MCNIYKDGELTIEATNKNFLLVRQEGNCQVAVNTIISHAPFNINGIGTIRL